MECEFNSIPSTSIASKFHRPHKMLLHKSLSLLGPFFRLIFLFGFFTIPAFPFLSLFPSSSRPFVFHSRLRRKRAPSTPKSARSSCLHIKSTRLFFSALLSSLNCLNLVSTEHFFFATAVILRVKCIIFVLATNFDA